MKVRSPSLFSTSKWGKMTLCITCQSHKHHQRRSVNGRVKNKRRIPLLPVLVPTRGPSQQKSYSKLALGVICPSKHVDYALSCGRGSTTRDWIFCRDWKQTRKSSKNMSYFGLRGTAVIALPTIVDSAAKLCSLLGTNYLDILSCNA